MDIWIQQNQTFTAGREFPTAGPSTNHLGFGLRAGYNNFYGYRVPKKGKLLGFTLDYCQKPRDGIFHVFYWKPNREPYPGPGQPNPSADWEARFCAGGPIVCNLRSDQAYLSGCSLMGERYNIDIEPDGFIFAFSDCSYSDANNNVTPNIPVGSHADEWDDISQTSNWYGPGYNFPYQPAAGPTYNSFHKI